MATFTTTSIIYIFFEVVIGALSVLGNCLVLLAIYKNVSLRTVTNCFIFSLALADLLVGIIVAPLAALSYLGMPEDFLGCVFINSLLILFTQISIFNLVAIAVERLIAIIHPFAYTRYMTKKMATAIIAVTWIVAVLIGLVPMFGWNEGPTPDNRCRFTGVISMDFLVYFNFFGFVLCPLLVVFGIYSHIFCVVRKQMAKITVLEVTLSVNHRHSRQFKKEIKAAKSLAILIFLFALCWLPVHILNAVTFLCGAACSFDIEYLLAAILLSHLNSAINPVLYAYGNSQFKVAFRKMLCRTSSWESSMYDAATTSRPRTVFPPKENTEMMRRNAVSLLKINTNVDNSSPPVPTDTDSRRLPANTGVAASISDPQSLRTARGSLISKGSS